MRHGLRLLAALVAFAGLGLWLGCGAHRGWTQTSVLVKTLDEVTGIEKNDYQDRFLPGLDFLAAAAAGAAILAGISFLFQNRPPSGKPAP